MNHQAYGVPAWLEQSANAPVVDPQAIGLHERLNGALDRGDTRAGLRVPMKSNVQNMRGPSRPRGTNKIGVLMPSDSL